VTPFIRKLRESVFGYPFITFTYKATPQVIKTALTKPTKISNIGKIKQGIESLSDLGELERERASEPDWIRDGFYVKLPMKDKHGRSAYFDLTYVLPFGDLVSGQWVNRGINRETGLPEGALPAQIRRLPLANIVRELGSNQDFYGNKIWKDGDDQSKQLGDVMRHLTKTYLPPLVADQIPGGYRANGERKPGKIQEIISGQPGQEQGGSQTRTLTEELLRNVGFKVQPFDVELQERFAESERRKAMQTLLKEEGLISEFNLPFIPKQK